MKDSVRGFLVFITIFLSVYGLAHLYIWWRLLKPLELTGALLRSVQVGFLLLFISFPLIHFWFRHENGWLVGAANWFSSVWMGMVVYFVLVTLASDLLRLVLFRHVFDGPVVSGVVAAIVVVITVYGLIEARRVGVTELRVRMPNLSSELRVAQISDVHMGLVVRGSRLEQIVNKVNSLQPDLIVITGDLVDAEALHVEDMIPLLQRLKAHHGVFAVTGNHEFYAGVGKVEAFLKQAGVTLLRNRSVTVAGGLQLVGLDDPVVSRFTGQPPPRITDVMERGKPTLLLLHTPVTALERLAAAGIHLQLSGHTHKGQLWPFNHIVKLIYKQTPYGLFSNGDATIYVSRGVGTWGPPMRVGAPPEITLVTLTR
jgi:predicted MPP superfamily phosphohydrolase